ncbi:MAG: diaminopimelate decarboxylase [Fibromonadaceae bacterium]|jgi:diaminopimelate decarboxylase|nr:diaminopimelate decarboxylase [Fibromonadaceae bacterium]
MPSENKEYNVSFGDKEIALAVGQFGSPLWIYDFGVIEKRIWDLRHFGVIRYAQKASPNINLLSKMRTVGVDVDAVSAGEVVRALRAGFEPKHIRYTADILDRDALDLIKEHSISVNIGSPDMLFQLHEAGINVPLAIRINPGFGHGHSNKVNTGGELSKHGIWHSDLPSVIKKAEELGFIVECLHIHIGSGSDYIHLSQVVSAMEHAVSAIGDGARESLKIISAGGGLPISYKRDEDWHLDLDKYYNIWDNARKRIGEKIGHYLQLEVEPGRYLVAESCVLATEIRAVKKMGKNLFYLIDAGFSDLIRPSFYGAYHHISIIPMSGKKSKEEVDAIIAGPLCESGDVFTQEEGGVVVSRKLPLAQVGDLLIIHDAGAYGSAMSSNYNSRLLAPEILWEKGKFSQIRKRQTFEHLLENEVVE